MISYERNGGSDGNDLNQTGESIKCMICGYYYFKMDYQPYVCNACHDFSINVMNLGDFFIVTIVDVDYRLYITGMDKKSCNFYLKKF